MLEWFKKSKTREVLLVGAIACSTLLPSLGRQCLWQDEAQTALIAKTVLQYGVPKGSDGKNYFSQEAGAEYGPNYIWKWHPWLSFYLLALSFKVFGLDTWAARIPFAAFGVATCLLVYWWARTHWRNRRTALLASIMLAFWVPYLLIARQCRFYSMAAFFSLWALDAYLRLVERKRGGIWMFVLAVTLLFHTFYFYAAVLVFTVLVHPALYERNSLRRLLWVIGGTGVLNAPWIIWFSSMTYPYSRGLDMKSLTTFASFAKNLGQRFLTDGVPLPWILTVLGLAWFLRAHRTSKPLSRELSVLSLLVLFCFIMVPAVAAVSPGYFFRYLSPLLAPGALVAGFFIDRLWKWDRKLACAVVLMTLISQPLGEYIYELTHDYNGPMEGMVAYFQKYGKSSDVLLTTYGDMPLKFYTDMRIIGGLTGEDLSIAKNPDWIIIRHHANPSTPVGLRVYDYIFNHIPRTNYQVILLDSPDAEWENREDVLIHRFITPIAEPHVNVFRKVK